MSWKVELTWEEAAPAAVGTGFKVYKSTNGGSYSLADTLAITTLEWEDTSVAEGNKYNYRVTEYNAGNGGESPVASVQVDMASSNTELNVKVFIDGSIEVDWDQRTYNLGYRLEKQTDGGSWGLVTETSTNDIDKDEAASTASTGHDYKYRVRPIGASGYEPAWFESSLHYYSTNKVELTWDEGGTAQEAEHGDGYNVYKSEDGADYVLWKVIDGIETTTFYDPDITTGTYWYRVSETLEGNEDELCAAISIMINTAPTAPTGLLCEGETSPTGITDLTPEFSAIFNDPDTGDTSTKFEVEVNAAVGFDGTVMWDSGYLIIASVDEGDRCAAVSYAGTALELDGTTYYWRCRFQDAGEEDSPWSSVGNFRMKNEVDMEIGDSVSTSDTIAFQKALGLQCNESLSVSTSNLQSLAKAFPEILAMADSIDFISAFVRSYGEEIGLSDALLNEISKVVVEDIALAGSISRAITAIMTGETLGLADSTSFDTIREITESLSLSDQMATLILFTRQVEETFSLEDTVAVATLKALRETMPVADALVREISIARAEGLSITAALDKVAGLTRALAETLGLDSEFLLHTIRDMFISESLGLADQYAHVWATSKLFAEILALTDKKSISRLLVRVESLGLTDQALFISQIYRSMTDTIGMIDSIVAAVGKELADTLPFADAIGKAVSTVRSDALAIDDDLVSALARTISDQFNLDDEYVRVFIKNVLLLETIAMTGTAASVTVISKIVAETLTVSDAAQFQVIIERVETLALGEQAAFIFAYRRAVADTVGLDESITRTMQKALSDTLVVASALVRDLTAGKTFAEVIALDAESIRAVAKVIADQFDLSAEFIEETAKYIIALETLALSGEMVKAVTAQRILSELFKVGDRLRLKGMWDDPNIKVIVSMLRASMITTRLR